MKMFTDYPFEFLGDTAYKTAPLRQVTLLAYDLDKYVRLSVEGHIVEIKAAYVYKNRRKTYLRRKSLERWVEQGKINELVWG